MIDEPDSGAVDHALLRSLAPSPMSLAEWRARLREHAELLDGGGAQLRGARFDGALVEGARGLPEDVGTR